MSHAAPEASDGNQALGIDLSAVALFPLPGVVLFPRAILPLHIFEQRYRTMVVDALAGDRLIAMALLKQGWESCYHAAPAIETVVCVGHILSEEKLPDGKYNLLLQGVMRAEVQGEDRHRPYRMARLAPLPETRIMEIDLDNERHRLRCMLNDSAIADLPIVRQFRQMLAGPTPTAEIVDLLAFNFLDDVALKQSLLAETDVRARVCRVIGALDAIRPAMENAVRRKRRRVGSVN